MVVKLQLVLTAINYNTLNSQCLKTNPEKEVKIEWQEKCSKIKETVVFLFSFGYLDI